MVKLIHTIYDGVVQPFDIVSHDGVFHRDQNNQPSLLTGQTSVLLLTAGRVELIIESPVLGVTSAYLKTLLVDTGPEGDYDPERNILMLIPDSEAPPPEVIIPPTSSRSYLTDLSTSILNQAPHRTRKLYFSSTLEVESDPNSDTIFFLTVEGQVPTPFSMNSLYNPPSIVVEAGTIEDWIIENRAGEVHVFHIHQLHFLLSEMNRVKLSSSDIQFYDTIMVPFWDGISSTYPSVTIRISFTQEIIGKFVYHCHILEHEDKGMMAIIEVIPPVSSSPPSSPVISSISLNLEHCRRWIRSHGMLLLGILQILFVLGVGGVFLQGRYLKHSNRIVLEESSEQENVMHHSENQYGVHSSETV